MNPATIVKLMGAKKKFSDNHPKFISFVNNILSRSIDEGTVIELTVTRPGEAPVTTNIKVKQSDLELFEELKNMKM